MGRKSKIPTKTVKIDHKTWIEVPADVNDEVARTKFLNNKKHSETALSNQNRRKGNSLFE